MDVNRVLDQKEGVKMVEFYFIAGEDSWELTKRQEM